MDATVVPVVVLVAAALHAVWNALAHALPDKVVGFALINAAFLGGGVLLACLAPLPDARAWPYLAASALLQVLYQLLLLQAYRLGDFGQMYPLARGTAPWLVAALSVLVLGRPLGAAQWAGVLVISAGLAGLALADGVPGRAQLPAVAAALGTGAMIAGYTVVDGTGVRTSTTVLGYIAWLFVLQGAGMLLTAVLLRGPSLFCEPGPGWVQGLAGGVLSLTAYGLVVWAQAHGDLATIAALRETSIVIAALIGALVFRERLGAARMAAGAVVVAGIAVLQLAPA
ncbi:EamA family transporter [Streptomyces sp. NRRL B-24484]|uniref:EamA family transporter n=1 Tax=Streptomyces sp. NRRL B-24484 TaxID=1463833 RepID=UPI0004C1F5C8|nr:EamA family transporter [Streptomyces sp. NRRL B-24484]